MHRYLKDADGIYDYKPALNNLRDSIPLFKEFMIMDLRASDSILPQPAGIYTRRYTTTPNKRG